MAAGLQPYPEYRDSGVEWLGEIPAHWDVLPGHATYSYKQVKNKGMIESTVLSLSYGQIIVKPSDKLRGLVPESFETYQVVDPSDIIIRSTDLQNDQNSLRIGFVRHRGIITSAYLCLSVREKLLPEYGYLVLNTYDLTKEIYRYGSGLRQNLDFSDIKRMPIWIPPIEEQEAIVRYLDHADRLIRRHIRAKRRQMALLNEQKQAIIYQAVTGGIDANVQLRPSGIDWFGDIPQHWQIQPALAVYREKQIKNTGLVDTQVLSLSYGSIVVKPPEKLHGLVPESFETYQIIEPGDIIIRVTDLQNDQKSLRIGISKNRGIITSAYMCLRVIAYLNNEYAYLVLHVFDVTKAIYSESQNRLQRDGDGRRRQRFEHKLMLISPS